MKWMLLLLSVVLACNNPLSVNIDKPDYSKHAGKYFLKATSINNEITNKYNRDNSPLFLVITNESIGIQSSNIEKIPGPDTLLSNFENNFTEFISESIKYGTFKDDYYGLKSAWFTYGDTTYWYFFDN